MRLLPSSARGLTLATLIGVLAGAVLGLAYRGWRSTPAEKAGAPAPKAAPPGVTRPPPCGPPPPTAPTLASRARFMPGAQDTPPALPEVQVKPRGPGATHGTRKLPGAPADAVIAFAFHYKSDIYARPGQRRKVAGHARRGTVIPVARRLKGSGCKKGTWYELKTGGAVCTGRGFIVGVDPLVPDLQFRQPLLKRPLIFSYARQKRRGAPRLFRLPGEEEAREVAAAAQAKGEAQRWPEVVERAMDGAFLLALDRLEVAGGRRYYRTVRGRYIQADDLELFPVHEMHGELLGHGLSLPLAFVWGNERPTLSLAQGRVTVCGRAPKHARFQVTGERTVARERRVSRHREDDRLIAENWRSLGRSEEGACWWRATDERHRQRASGPARIGQNSCDELLIQGAGGLTLRAAHVRVARKIPRPESVPPGERWIHISLGQQTLVAYQGDTPVFATLVSSGKEGYAPPLGTFPIYGKHLSVTMNATDAIDGFYEVEEVPWTMYYWESYALHGAYWHDDFGKPKSHGCTNLAPPDARWLFHWTSPKVPEGWNGRLATGTRIYYSR